MVRPARVLLVDDSATVREVIRARLTERGFEVVTAADALRGAEIALSAPPDVVVTDLWMPGVSGVQLCRLLKGESRTADVPVVLLSAESQRRARFWARSAGAAAFVTKGDFEVLVRTLDGLGRRSPPDAEAPAFSGSRTPVQNRLFQRLDRALFESVIAGRARSLANDDGDAASVFRGLADMLCDVASYRWLALHLESSGQLWAHAPRGELEHATQEVRACLADKPGEVITVGDERPVWSNVRAPLSSQVVAGGRRLGSVAFSPTESPSHEDRDLISILTVELAGPLRVVSLVEQATRLAMIDALTGLLNRRAFEDAMGRRLADSVRHGGDVSLLLLDVDHFKRVNDEHGHDTGDVVLRSVGDVLRRVARRSDIAARWGGEEFVVGLPHTGPAGARVAAERVRRAVAEKSVEIQGGRALAVTVSVGVASVPAQQGLEELLSRADRAMYGAKRAGRNRVGTDQGEIVL